MKKFVQKIIIQAKKFPKRIVFPESEDKRIIKAVEIIARKKIARPILLGDPKTLSKKFTKKILSKIKIINPKDAPNKKRYIKEMYNIRKNKGWSLAKCKKLIENPNYFGTMMVQCDDADGLISGATHTTAETLRPALQIIKTKEHYHHVSGLFFMVLEGKTLLFADCAVNIDPSAKDLAEIAADSAETAKMFGLTPRIAMLSFATHGSASHPLVDKVKEATKLVKKRFPRLKIDGELQVDAAIVPKVCKMKSPKCVLKGNANVLIFPDLNSGNISYKLVERLGHAQAIGPLIQGLRKPVNDLSEGCSVDDIVKFTAFTVVEAQRK